MTVDRFVGQVAVVTGAAAGIGEAVTNRLVSEGARVVAVDVDGTGLARLASQLPHDALETVTADVATQEGVENYVSAAARGFGGIDLFHNNAGTEGASAPLHESDVHAFDRVMRINVRGVYLGLRAVLREMRTRGRGAVVNTSSVAGLRARAGLASYVASKHAVLGLTRTAAVEAADHGIRVNAVCPGPVSTGMLDRIEQMPSQQRRGESGATSTLRRYGTPDEIAALVCWLLSDEAAFVNGAVYLADGGRSAM